MSGGWRVAEGWRFCLRWLVGAAFGDRGLLGRCPCPPVSFKDAAVVAFVAFKGFEVDLAVELEEVEGFEVGEFLGGVGEAVAFFGGDEAFGEGLEFFDVVFAAPGAFAVGVGVGDGFFLPLSPGLPLIA